MSIKACQSTLWRNRSACKSRFETGCKIHVHVAVSLQVNLARNLVFQVVVSV